ncbi:MAG: type I methionyl aminopeptidase [Candidatus Altiarchaeales archaeon]|nr:type I methionyl aminopeptidase [Candidatus Altiarchaeales archaeon]
MSVIKTPEQVLKMKKSAAVLADCLDILESEAKTKAGMTGRELDALAETFIRDNGGIPAFKNYSMSPGVPGFPASICFSRNHVLVHGIPDDKPIEDGDILTIDCGLSIDGWFADFARLFGVGNISEEDERIMNASHKALHEGIKACRPGNRLSDISNSIQSSIFNSRYENVLQFCGHAIGREMHEAPQVPNFGRPGRGITLKPGMVFCLEPMLLKHKVGLGVLPDKWTIVTLDGSRATHVEHMVLITENGPEVLSHGGNTRKL